MKFEDLIERELAEKEVLEEASHLETVQNAYNSLSIVFESLSDAFSLMARKGTVDGGGEVPSYFRKAEVALVSAKDRIKHSIKNKSEDRFDPLAKKALGEISLSLEKLSEKCKNISDSATEPDFETVPLEPMPDENIVPKEEAVKSRRKKMV